MFCIYMNARNKLRNFMKSSLGSRLRMVCGIHTTWFAQHLHICTGRQTLVNIHLHYMSEGRRRTPCPWWLVATLGSHSGPHLRHGGKNTFWECHAWDRTNGWHGVHVWARQKVPVTCKCDVEHSWETGGVCQGNDYGCMGANHRGDAHWILHLWIEATPTQVATPFLQL